MRIARLWFVAACGALCFAPSAKAAEESAKPAERSPAKLERDNPPQIERDVRTLEGWQVRFGRRLAPSEHADLGRRAERLLGDKLYEIAQFLPADRSAELRKVTIVVDLDHGKLTSAQYHPSPQWLEDHGYDRALAKCVHIPSTRLFVGLRHQRTQPSMVMHELAHAYHDQVLDFNNAEVRAVYEAARRSGTYDKVLHIHGHNEVHYAIKNHHEYFAELTEAYFGTNDFYPFVRGELQRHDPQAHALLEKIWGKLP